MQTFPLGKVTATAAGASVTALEPHYSVQQVAELWGLCEDAARAIFRSESGVIKIERPKARYKRAYTTLRIPLSVLQRVHRRMSAV
jgi:hypothetical protein